MYKSAFFTTLLFISTFMVNVWAIDLEEVSLEEISTTGQSFSIDRGILENFDEGTFARFYLQKGPKEFPKVFLVAEGELVKSFPRKSYWVMRKIYIQNAIKEKSKVLIFSIKKVTSGRPLKIKNHHVVLSKSNGEDVDSYLDQNKENVPARLVKAGANYEPSPDVYEKDEMKGLNSETHVLITTYENYKIKEGKYFSEEFGDETMQKYYFGNTQVNLGDIKKAEDKKLFDSVADNYLKKTNGMKYGIKSFYNESQREQGHPEVNSKGSISSTYDEAKYKALESDHISPVALAKLNRDGDQWSSDMDDVSLRRYFIQTGMEKEARRRELALNELDGHEFIIYYSNAVMSNGSSEDKKFQGRVQNFGFSYDLHLSRTSPNLKQWSVQFLYETGFTEYENGNYNIRSEESAYGAYLNYYFINNPLTLHSFIYMAGIGMKSGSAKISSPELSQDYSYQALTLPALQVMTKYRFRTGDLNEDTVNVGASINFGINLDIKNLSSYDSMEDDINSKISFYDLKYTLGMSLFF